jgi:hypothetical protein
MQAARNVSRCVKERDPQTQQPQPEVLVSNTAVTILTLFAYVRFKCITGVTVKNIAHVLGV